MNFLFIIIDYSIIKMIRELNVIIAVSKDFGIGKNNRLPWKIPSEIKLFKEKTMNCILIVGNKTYKSLPKLSNREVYRISRSVHPLSEETKVFPSFESAYESALKTGKNIFVIGGKLIYEYVFAVYKHRIRLYISFIDKIYECDTFFDKRLLNGFETVKEVKYEDFVYREMTYNDVGECQYLQLLETVSCEDDYRDTRNGRVRSIFNYSMNFDLRKGFPLLTTKKMFFKGVVEELLFFMRGDVDSKVLENKGINIWKGNTSREFLDSLGFTDRKEGDMRFMYGSQWRHFNGDYDESLGTMVGGVDQLKKLLGIIIDDPFSRRMIMTSYNPLQAEEGVLYPCHSLTLQFYVDSSKKFIDMFCYCRSVDVFLGLPFNIASSSLLLYIIAKITGLSARFLYFTLGDCHIYDSHDLSVKEQLSRIPYKFPTLILPDELSSIEDVEKLTYKDFKILEYKSHDKIYAPMIA